MRHRKLRARLGRTASHRKAMLSNMITSLFKHERIKTTIDKAKEARRFAEKAITLAKKSTLHARRLAFRRIKDEEVLDKLFAEIGPRFAERNGGYTRIIRIGHRQGDGSEMAYLELVDRVAPVPEKETKKAGRKKKAQAPAEAEAAAEEKVEAEAEAPEGAPEEETETPAGDENEAEETGGHDVAEAEEAESAGEDEEKKEDGPEEKK